MHLKRFIVSGLITACDLLRHHPYPCKLAGLSADLDERWGTGVWKDVGPLDNPNPFPWFKIVGRKP